MLSTLFWIAVGAFIGWNFPQPSYMKWVQNWATEKWSEITNKDNNTDK